MKTLIFILIFVLALRFAGPVLMRWVRRWALRRMFGPAADMFMGAPPKQSRETRRPAKEWYPSQRHHRKRFGRDVGEYVSFREERVERIETQTYTPVPDEPQVTDAEWEEIA